MILGLVWVYSWIWWFWVGIGWNVKLDVVLFDLDLTFGGLRFVLLICFRLDEVNGCSWLWICGFGFDCFWFLCTFGFWVLLGWFTLLV